MFVMDKTMFVVVLLITLYFSGLTQPTYGRNYLNFDL